ncbi:MAG: PilW family protein [Pseudomonadota bacterium]
MIACVKHQNKRLASPEGGFTIVEMMVALTVGLFLVGGLISLLVSTSAARTELDKSSRQIENGRYALQLLSDDVRHAGFLGTYMPSGAAATAPDPCATAVVNLGFATSPALQVPVSVYGYDGSAADPSCVTDRLAGTGILVVRRVSTTGVPAASPVAGEVYFQSSSCAPLAPPPEAAFVIGTGGFTLQQKDCATAALLNKYMVRVYYVSSCNVCAPSDNIPTLKVAEYFLGAMTITPLVEGIQNMQVEYGIDMDNDGGPDCYISNPDLPAAGEIATCINPAGYWATATAIQNWSNVMTVRINILARNNEPSGDWSDTRTYNLGLAGTAGPFNDRYKRHIYSAVARVVNAAGRRETP